VLGGSNEVIAAALGTSRNTVLNVLARAFEVLGAANRANVVRLAVRSP
jgi:DNA-binding CsgD family transcriptional regulator